MQFFRFFTEFKDQNKYSLSSFYKKYKYKFRPFQDTAPFEVKLIDQLKVKYPDAVKHFYLITAYMDVPKNFLTPSNYERSARKLPADFFHGHVAGND